MEQHYIIVFGINGENVNMTYTHCIVVKRYPGSPYELLKEMMQAVEDNSIRQFSRFIKGSDIAIKSLTKVF